MTEQEFWAITEPYGWGVSTTDYSAIRSDLIGRITPDESMLMFHTFRELKGKLMTAIEGYEHRTGARCPVGDDGFEDLCAHIIGLGKAAYEAHLANPALAIERAERRDYKESFGYAIPHRNDYRTKVAG